jgi:hypothetical protein
MLPPGLGEFPVRRSRTTGTGSREREGPGLLRAVQPVGDWLGDDHEPWQQPAPGRVQQLKDAPGRPVEHGDW